jgi:hypothetical protein
MHERHAAQHRLQRCQVVLVSLPRPAPTTQRSPRCHQVSVHALVCSDAAQSVHLANTNATRLRRQMRRSCDTYALEECTTSHRSSQGSRHLGPHGDSRPLRSAARPVMVAAAVIALLGSTAPAPSSRSRMQALNASKPSFSSFSAAVVQSSSCVRDVASAGAVHDAALQAVPAIRQLRKHIGGPGQCAPSDFACACTQLLAEAGQAQNRPCVAARDKGYVHSPASDCCHQIQDAQLFRTRSQNRWTGLPPVTFPCRYLTAVIYERCQDSSECQSLCRCGQWHVVHART